MTKLKQIIKAIPWYGYLITVILLLIQLGLYHLGQFIAISCNTISYAFTTKLPLDDFFPVVPFFIFIYCGAYIFWAHGLLAVSSTKKQNYLNFIIGLCVVYITSFIIFAALPSYMNRVDEGLMDLGKKGGLYLK